MQMLGALQSLKGIAASVSSKLVRTAWRIIAKNALYSSKAYKRTSFVGTTGEI
jgi:hypothetical protein